MVRKEEEKKQHTTVMAQLFTCINEMRVQIENAWLSDYVYSLVNGEVVNYIQTHWVFMLDSSIRKTDAKYCHLFEIAIKNWTFLSQADGVLMPKRVLMLRIWLIHHAIKSDSGRSLFFFSPPLATNFTSIIDWTNSSSYYFRQCIVEEKLLHISFLQTISMESVGIMSATHTHKCNPVDNGEKVHIFFFVCFVQWTNVRPNKRQIGQCTSLREKKNGTPERMNTFHFIIRMKYYTANSTFSISQQLFFFWLSQFRESFPFKRYSLPPNRYREWVDGEWFFYWTRNYSSDVFILISNDPNFENYLWK